MLGFTYESLWTPEAHRPAEVKERVKRYWHHPESGCVFMTDGERPGTDGLVEEVDAAEFERLSASYATLEAAQ